MRISSYQYNVVKYKKNDVLGGWTIIQKRVDASTDFWVSWSDYAKGFGDAKNNYWAGNDYMNAITSQPFTPYELKIDMVANDGSELLASYDKFKVDSADNNYQLSLGNFTGTGNGMQSFFVYPKLRSC